MLFVSLRPWTTRFGFNKHLPFPSLCFSTNTHSKKPPDDITIHTQTERMDPMIHTALCVRVFIDYFLQKKKVLCFFSIFFMPVGFLRSFTLAIYPPTLNLGVSWVHILQDSLMLFDKFSRFNYEKLPRIGSVFSCINTFSIFVLLNFTRTRLTMMNSSD